MRRSLHFRVTAPQETLSYLHAGFFTPPLLFDLPKHRFRLVTLFCRPVSFPSPFYMRYGPFVNSFFQVFLVLSFPPGATLYPFATYRAVFPTLHKPRSEARSCCLFVLFVYPSTCPGQIGVGLPVVQPSASRHGFTTPHCYWLFLFSPELTFFFLRRVLTPTQWGCYMRRASPRRALDLRLRSEVLFWDNGLLSPVIPVFCLPRRVVGDVFSLITVLEGVRLTDLPTFSQKDDYHHTPLFSPFSDPHNFFFFPCLYCVKTCFLPAVTY